MDKDISKEIDRIQWIDTAKLIGIYLVILGHLHISRGKTNINITNFIFTFHMPLFFFLSGLVDKQRSIKETFLKSTRNLIIPYIFFFLLTYPCWIFIGYYRHPEIYERGVYTLVIKPAIGMLLGVGFDTKYSITTNATLWFLLGLFWCRIFNAIGKQKRYGRLFISIGGIVFSLFFWKKNLFMPFSFASACMAFLFYYSAVFLREHKIKVIKRYKLIYTIVGCVIVLICVFFNGRIDINLLNYGKFPLLFFVGAFAGILMVLSLSQLLPPMHSFGNFLAANTLTILAVHGVINGIIKNIYTLVLTKMNFKAYAAKPALSLFEGVVIALLSLFISALPCYIIRKYLPFMIGGGYKTHTAEKTE